MTNKEELRSIVKANINSTVAYLNQALRGEIITDLEATLSHLGRGGKLPAWYAQLATDHTLPNLDGKTIGSVIEMILVAVLEKYTFKSLKLPP